jgi:hypothetical protein
MHLHPPKTLLHCRTQIIVTHDQEEAFDLADQVVIFNRGLIEQSGSPNEIIKRPATPFVMGFVGDTNSVPAGCMLVRRSGFQPSQGKARVMFRPSDIKLSQDYSATMDGQQVRKKLLQLWVLYVISRDLHTQGDGSVSYVLVCPGCQQVLSYAGAGSKFNGSVQQHLLCSPSTITYNHSHLLARQPLSMMSAPQLCQLLHSALQQHTCADVSQNLCTLRPPAGYTSHRERGCEHGLDHEVHAEV